MRALMDNLTVVLVGIRHSGNIGSIARAMKNTGVSRLALVNPAPYDTAEVYNLAWRSEEIVRNARVCAAIGEAVAGCGLVVGTTRRKGWSRRPVIELREAVPIVAAATRQNRVALLFGREDRGLSNEELSFCQMVLSIPASHALPSLNVAQAVMVVCHGLFDFSLTPRAEIPPPLVPQAELLALYARLEKALASIGYGSQGDRKILSSVMRTLRRLFGRSGIRDDELRALHGICQQIERHAGRHGAE